MALQLSRSFISIIMPDKHIDSAVQSTHTISSFKFCQFNLLLDYTDKFLQYAQNVLLIETVVTIHYIVSLAHTLYLI